MATKAGKVQLKDIKRGKTFYYVRVDFPIISAGVVGLGEVESVVRLRVTSRPYLRRLSNTMAFQYINDSNAGGYIDLEQMERNHRQNELTEEGQYFVLLKSRQAAERFIKMFDDRPPSKKETVRTLLREANLNAKQRGFS